MAGRVVVVGAGLAGLGTVQALRARGYAGRVTLLGAEPHRPYDRPPLSKAVLLDDPPPDPTLPADWAALDVDVRLGVAAMGVREDAVLTSAREEVPYDGLVLACGARPVRLPGDETAVHLRTVEDAQRLRDGFVAGRRVVVVGAGWIGAEIATAAARRGCRVTVLEAGGAPLAAVLPPAVGALLRPWWAQAGVELRTSTVVASVRPDGVLLGSGEVLAADLVVVAVGVRPAVGWLAGSPVPLDPGGGGVVVDATLRAAPRVWAVGDVIARWSPRYGVRIRGEHWDDALHGPDVAARGLLGEDATYDPVPYVWSEQFGRVLQWCGHLDGDDLEPVVRGDPGENESWSLVWLAEGRIAAVLAVDRPHDAVQGRRLATAGTPVDEAAVADPTRSLRSATQR